MAQQQRTCSVHLMTLPAKYICLAVLFCLCQMLSNSAFSAAPAQDLFTPQEQAWLDKHPLLRVVVDPDYLPYEHLDQSGRYQGIGADYTHLIAGKLGVEIEVIATQSWAESLAMVKNRKADLLPVLTKNKQRSEYLNFAEPHHNSPIVIVTRNDQSELTNLEDFEGKRFAAIKSYSSFKLIEARYPGIIMVPVDNVEQALRAVATGKADGTESDLAVASYFIQQQSLNNLVFVGDAEELGMDRMGFGARKDWPELIPILNKALASITPQQSLQIRRKWGVLADLEPTSPLLQLTEQEQRWLQQHPRIRLGVDPDFAPFEWLDEQGVYSGLAADYMALVAERLGVQFDVVPELSWDEVASKGRVKELDIHPLLTPTEARKKYYLFTRKYVRDPYVIIGRDDHKAISSEADLAGKRIALVKGYSATELLLKHQPDVIPVYVDTELDSLLAVVTGDVEVTVGHLGTLAYKIRQHYLANLSVVARTNFFSMGMGIAVRDDWPMLRDLLDRALASITAQERRQINQRWGQVIDVEDEAPGLPELTVEEQQWLLDHPLIRVASDPNWAPLEFVDASGQFKGLSRDYLDKLENMLGVKFEAAKNLTWQQAVEKVKRGELDVFSAVRETPDRESYVDFTSEYLSQPIMIFASSEVAYISSLQQLEGRRVAVVESYATEELLANHHPGIELETTSSVTDALRLLAKGDVDAFVGNIITTTYYLNTLGLTQIKVVGETPYRYSLTMAVRKDWPILTSILDKALKALPQDERNQIQQRWMPVSFEVEPDYSWLWKPFTVFALIIAVIIYWNRRLALEVIARKETEQALIEQQQRLDDVFKVTPSGLWDWNMMTDECFCSPAYFEILGYDAKGFDVNNVDTVWLNLVHPDDKSKILALHDASATSDEPFSMEYRLRCKDGSYKWVLDKGQVVARNAADESTRMIGCYVDIEAAKEFEAELRDAKEGAEAANLAKSTFLANMSHELRTPLNAVLGFSELMGHDQSTTREQKENLQMINTSGQHLLGLINDVLDMSKIEAGHATLETESTDLYQLLADVSSMMKGRATGKGLSFHLDRQPSVPQYVTVDSGKLKQILINLLGNAIKFTNSGGVELSVKAEPLSQDEWHLLFAVKDTGVGIAEQQLDSIFEPFVQAQHGTNGQNGTGLGLAISHQFAQLMGGRLTLESELDQGSLFCLEIKVQSSQACAVTANQQQQIISGLAEHEPEWRILIVEDQASNRALLRSQLEAAGFSVQEAHDGQQGIDAFLTWQPHLIWMDMRMPVMDGYQATQRIRGLPGGNEVKILALTASVFREQATEIIAVGCDEVYYKPYLEQDMLAAMANHLPLHYCYRSDQPEGDEKRDVDAQLTDLRSLPEELIAQLLMAAKMGDVAELQLLVANLSETYQSAKRQLAHYIDDFQLQQLIEVLQRVATFDRD